MSQINKKMAFVVVPLLAALASGCANRHSVNVGSIPDDYRTNHPIMISEKETVLDIPVGSSERRATKSQADTLSGFLSGYDATEAPALHIQSPSGSANAHAAGQVSRDFAAIARKNGVPGDRIHMSTYQAGSTEVAAPIRVSFVGVKAHTNKCGKWPADIAGGADNKLHANFGCSYQNNMAAQIANPNDLLGPRKMSPIDAERRSIAIDDYRSDSSGWSPGSSY